MRIFFLIFVIMALLNTPEAAASPTTIGDMALPPVHVQDHGMERLLRQVSATIHIVIGFESDVDYVTEKQLALDFPGGTLAQLADKCVSLLPGSSWRIIENRSLVISLPSVASQLAHLPIEYPEIAGATREQVWSDLSKRPELTSWLKVTGCYRFEPLAGSEFRKDKPSIVILSGRANLEQILETASVSAPSDRYSWQILKYVRQGQCEITITLW